MILTTMKLKHFYLIILISLFAQQAIAQTFDDHYMIGWKADQPLTFDLFEGQPTDDQIKKMKERNLYAEMVTRLWSVLDVPSSKRGWKSKIEVYAKDNDSIFQEQRALVDQRLAELAKYATTDEDIRRQVTNQPEKGYKMAEKIMGDLKKRPDISY